MFHRVDDWRALPSSRFFQRAERLAFYDGAVRAVLFAEQRAATSTPAAYAPVPTQGVSTRPVVEDMSLMAALSDHPGFPGIEYVS